MAKSKQMARARAVAESWVEPHPRQPRLSLAGWIYIVVALAALVALAIMAHAAAYFPIDLTSTQAMQRLQSPTLDAVALSIDWVGYAPQVAILTVGITLALFALGQRWEAAVFVLAAVTEAVVATLLKLLVRRPRPEVTGIHIYQPLGDFTFPSGHVSSYIMVFGLLAYFCYVLLRPSWWRTLLIVVLIGLVVAVGPVRIYLGEHWLSDVAAGYLLGSLGLILMLRVYGWGQKRFAWAKPRLFK